MMKRFRRIGICRLAKLLQLEDDLMVTVAVSA
jgi:hypothetical protein